MNRIARTVVGCVLAGATVNAVVAWGCALWSPLKGCDLSGEGLATADVARLVPAEWRERSSRRSSVTYSCLSRGFGSEQQHAATAVLVPGDSGGPPERLVHLEYAGWPWYSLECHGLSDGLAGAPPAPCTEWHGGLMVADHGRLCASSVASPWVREGHPIPMRPLWPGFALNTGVYGAAAWLMVAVPRGARRWRRRRGGLCAGCGYPVEGLERCPECGAAS